MEDGNYNFAQGEMFFFFHQRGIPELHPKHIVHQRLHHLFTEKEVAD